jgi:glycine cleavage system H protein
MFPEDLKYTKNHSWVKVEGNKGKIGLTNFAQEQLSDIVTVELPAAGKAVTAMNPFGTIESVKATMDLITPVSGEVTEVNEDLNAAPEKVNQDPYGEGWLVRLAPEDPGELGALLDSEGYRAVLEAESE